jgi:hypothetical protein
LLIFVHWRRDSGIELKPTELEEELRLHIQLRADDLQRVGLPRAQAERRARIEFGSQENFKEECREAIAGNFIDILIQDVRFSVRMLRKSRGFTVIVVLTIALGIGATTKIFSVIDATLLQPLPYPQSERLVSIQADLPAIDAHDVGISQPELRDLQKSGIFEYVSPTWYDENNLTGSTQPMRVRLTIGRRTTLRSCGRNHNSVGLSTRNTTRPGSYRKL